MKAKFKKFLTDNGAYRKFVRNLKGHRNMSFSERCDLYETWCNPIVSAFSWHRTPEGHDYWYKLNKKWNDQTT